MEYKIKYYTLKIKGHTGAINTPQNAIQYFKDEARDVQEKLLLWGLNTKNKTVLKHIVAKGGMNAIYVSPKDILIPLLHNRCVNAILLHNHPSGDFQPSNEDIEFTRKVKQAMDIVGIHLLDHIIVTPTLEYFSFKKEQLI